MLFHDGYVVIKDVNDKFVTISKNNFIDTVRDNFETITKGISFGQLQALQKKYAEELTSDRDI